MAEDDDDEFDEFPHARKDDPDTSHDAVPKDLSAQSLKVLRAYVIISRPLLDHDAYRIVGIEGAGFAHQRCSDLRAKGYIKRVGKARTPSNKTGYTCVITDKGLAYWRSKVHD